MQSSRAGCSVAQSSELNRARWLSYLGERRGTYEYRTLRYSAVYDEMKAMGLADHDLIVDIGAGMCDFDRYLRQVHSFDGRYLPVDGAIDGTNLNEWTPQISADFFVSIEVIEHLRDPWSLIRILKQYTDKGIVLTTPNPRVVDVLSLDKTHITPISREELEVAGFTVTAISVFGAGDDTLLATHNPMAAVYRAKFPRESVQLVAMDEEVALAL